MPDREGVWLAVFEGVLVLDAVCVGVTERDPVCDGVFDGVFV